ncbi:hypothetical protein APA25_34370, partial [Pseudomonas aeruginosa]
MRKRWARPRPSSWADCSRVRPALVPWACSCTALPSTKRSPTERQHEQHQQQDRFQHQSPALHRGQRRDHRRQAHHDQPRR